MSIQGIFQTVLFVAALTCAPLLASANPSDLEAVTWQAVAGSEDVEQLQAFLEAYPDGQFAEEARQTLDDLRTREEGYSLEETIFENVGSVTFTTPMAFGNEYIIGRSLSQIIDSSPAFPPIEGLPAEIWQNQSCKSCHSWTRADLCVQANTYVAMSPSRYREKQHPFGGMLKINLRNWAQNGCQ